MTEVSVYQLVRPFAWIAATAFAVGFAGYLAIGPGEPSLAHGPDAPVMASVASAG
ncbi:hypothetical protein [Phenylobacterium sp.]|uniref:hypothetical protein n=1 Tax=Phenylobacterium sp. TaxID=1871053 RepID=UPI0025FD9A5F|nr:hypothetical protein [Phenylobacterium sp.]